jgi:hypothetical protein
MIEAQEALTRARSISEQIFERQYREGMRTIQSSEWASDIYTLILNQCPHLKEEEVVRLFRNRHPSEADLVLGEALFREYNRTHARKPR